MRTIRYDLLLKWVLWLIAIHSICFGISLVVLPIPFIEFFGFSLKEKFFADQGGVFHLIVAVAYIWAALDLADSYSIHLFHAAWNNGPEDSTGEGFDLGRRLWGAKLDTDAAYHSDCLYEKLKRRYDVNS